MVFDLVVIGAGAAGLGAARAARTRGATVALVERSRVGGDCTFTGCIPSKSLIEAARHGAAFPDAVAGMRRAVERVAASEDASVLRGEGIEIVVGEARFTGPGSLTVDGVRVTGRAYVIASGAVPALPSIPGIGEVDCLTSETLFALDTAPASLAVIGGGPIGVEMAGAFASFGTSVALFEAAPRLLPAEEALASAILEQSLRNRGVEVHAGARIERIERVDGASRVRVDGASRVRVRSAGGRAVEVSQILAAVGRDPRTSTLGLDLTGVRVDARGAVVVDRRLRTTARGVFAAGDVTGPPYFTHVAYQAGRIAALNALSRVPARRISSVDVPHVTFSDPEVARVGVTEADVHARGAMVAFVPMSEVDRAITAGRTDGFVKLIATPRRVVRSVGGGRLIGATVVGPRAGEMLQELTLAVRLGLFPAQLASTLHAYPTWSVAVQQAAAQFFGVFDGRTARPADRGQTEQVELAVSPADRGTAPELSR